MFVKKPVEDFIGKGITLPIELVNGRTPLRTGFDLLRSSIRLILSWPSFQRFYLSEFGTPIGDLIEEPNDPILQDTLKQFIKESIATFERRVEFIEAITITDATSIQLTLRYRVVNTQQEDNFTFPFYSKIKY